MTVVKALPLAKIAVSWLMLKYLQMMTNVATAVVSQSREYGISKDFPDSSLSSCITGYFTDAKHGVVKPQ